MQITQNVRNYNRQDFPAQKSPGFTSKSKTIRELSDIAMRTRREFPLFSNTIIERYDAFNTPAAWKVFRFTEGLIGEVRGYSQQSKSKNQKILKSLDASKSLGVGNCSEYAEATCVACKLNGYNDAKVLSLYAYNPETKTVKYLDHAIVGINFNKPAEVETNIIKPIYMRDNDAIIVDTWTGIADYERNMTARYKHDKVFGQTLKPNDILCYVESGDIASLTRDDFLFLKHNYPSLANNKKSSIKDCLRWWVIDKEQFEFEPIGDLIKETYRANTGMKAAKSSEELTALYTKRAAENAEAKRLKRRQKAEEKNSSILQIRNKMRAIGQKIFK